MIRVVPQPEPNGFDRTVKTPGIRFLNRTPSPTTRQRSQHDYWTRVIMELHSAYGGICHFSCHWIPPDTGFITVEHFRPKSRFPRLAYEWSNFRLMCGTLNGRKGDHEDVLDPFNIQKGMFILEFPSLLVKPSSALDAQSTAMVEKTIARLKLNDEGTCLKNRIHYVDQYCKGDVNFSHLEQEAPFIAFELRRRRLIQKIKKIWSGEASRTIP